MRPRFPALLAAGLLLPQQAQSSPAPEENGSSAPTAAGLELDWDAPPQCPDAQAVRAQVIRLTGTTIQASRRLKAKASIQPTSDAALTLSLTTEFDGVIGKRALTGISCDSLTSTAALMLAMIVNPDMAPPQPAAVQPDAPRSARTSANAPELRPIWQLGAYAGVQMGMMRELSPSYGLSVGLALGRLSFHLLPGLTPRQDVFIPDTQPKVGGRLWLITLDTLGCWSMSLGPAALRPCLGLNVSRLHGRGLGVAQANEKTVYWSAAELGLFASLHLHREILFEIGGMGQVPFRRPRVYLDEIGAVSRPASFGFKALGGLAWVFE